MRKTQILLTNKNSVWGVMVNPVATNTYQHIISFDNQELKDWFINKYLFGDEAFDYKSVIKTKPDKPLTIKSDTKCEFRVDSKDYPEFTAQELANKDLAIVLRSDTEKGTEEYTFWAINKATKLTGNVYTYEGELDIFFTTDIKDMFIDTPVQIDRAHSNRILKNGLPDIFKDSINSFPEQFDEGFQFSFNNIENIFSQKISAIYFIASANISEKNIWVIDYEGRLGQAKANVSVNTGDTSEYETRVGFSAGVIFGVNNPSYLDYSGFVLFNTLKEAKIATSLSPIELKELKFNEAGLKTPTAHLYFGTTGGEQIDKDLLLANPSSHKDFSISIPFKINMENLKNINTKFDWKLEGKIYKQPYQELEVIDTLANTYQIDISEMSERDTIDFEINTKISLQGIHSQILFNKNFKTIKGANIIYGIYNIYDTTTDKEISNWEEYEADHKSQFGVQKASGVIHTIFGGLNGIKNVFSGNYLGGSNEIANAWQGLGNTLAMQHDLQNAPKDIIAGGTIQHILNSGLYNNEFNGRDFYQINYRRPNDIVLERLGWLFHIAGVNYNMTFHNINDLLKSRYYFNYVKTSMSLFENIRDELTFSQSIRTVIDKSMQTGLTIWHIRDKSTFKGIKQYNVNNVEMELL